MPCGRENTDLHGRKPTGWATRWVCFDFKGGRDLRLAGVRVCLCVCVATEGATARGLFLKVGLATATCAQVCAGAFMKTLALKCVCKCAYVHGLPRCSWSCDAEHCVREYGSPVYAPLFLHTHTHLKHSLSHTHMQGVPVSRRCTSAGSTPPLQPSPRRGDRESVVVALQSNNKSNDTHFNMHDSPRGIYFK